QKAPWTIISATGKIDNGNVSADQLQVLLQGVGECLIDDVQVIPPNGGNLITNSSFESAPTGWTADGAGSPSGVETTGRYTNSRRCCRPPTKPLSSPPTSTIRTGFRHRF